MKNLKRKVALLLAMVMVLSLVPSMSVFGADVGTRIGAPQPAPAAAQDNMVVPTSTALVFEIPVNQLLGFGANWDQVVIRVTPNNYLHNSTADFGQLRVVDGNTSTTSGSFGVYVPAVNPGYSPALNNSREFTLNNNGGNAFVQGQQGFNPQGVVRFEIPVFNVVDARSELTIDVLFAAGTAQESLNRVLGGQRLVSRVGAPNNYLFTVARQGDVRNLTSTRGAQGLSNIRFTEVGRVESNLDYSYTITLRAPANYIWVTSSNVSIDTPAASGFRVTGTPGFVGFSDNYRLMTITINGGALSRAPGTQGAARGFFDIGGLQVQPEPNHQLRAENLNVGVTLHQGTHNRLQDAPTRVDLHLGTQQLQGVEVTASAAVEAVSGIYGNPVHTDYINTATIQINENGAGSFLGAPIIVALDTPGVEIAGARWRRTNPNGNGNWYGGDGGNYNWRNTGMQIIDDTLILTHGVVNSANPINIEIQFVLDIAPGMGGTSIGADVTVMAMPATVNRNVILTNVVDPITLTSTASMPLNVTGIDLGMVFFNRLADFTVSEVEAGTFELNQQLDIFLIATANGVPVNIPTFQAATWDLGYTIDASELTFAPVAQNISTAAIPGAIVGVRYTVTRESNNEPASITFSSWFTGPMLTMPGVELQVVVKGTAVQMMNNTVDRLARGYNYVAYQTVVAHVPGDLGQNDVPGTTAPDAPVPAHVVPTNRPSVVNGAPLMVGNLINLRGLQELLGGTVTRELQASGRNLNAFTLPRSSNGIATVNIYEGVAVIMVAGTPLPAGNFGVQLIGGSWYISLGGLPALVGYTGVINGNLLHLYDL